LALFLISATLAVEKKESLVKVCGEMKAAAACDKNKGCQWMAMPQKSACYVKNCHLYEKVKGRAMEDACHQAPHCVYGRTPDGPKCFLDDCHMYAEDSNTERGLKHCTYANHCHARQNVPGRDGRFGCYWKDCSWYEPRGMTGKAKDMCKEAPGCQWKSGKCSNVAGKGYARGAVPMDHVKDELFDGDSVEVDHDDSEAAAAEEGKAAAAKPKKAAPAEDADEKAWHEDDGEGEGEGEAAAKDDGPNEVEDGEDEDYEAAMKKLQEESQTDL